MENLSWVRIRPTNSRKELKKLPQNPICTTNPNPKVCFVVQYQSTAKTRIANQYQYIRTSWLYPSDHYLFLAFYWRHSGAIWTIGISSLYRRKAQSEIWRVSLYSLDTGSSTSNTNANLAAVSVHSDGHTVITWESLVHLELTNEMYWKECSILIILWPFNLC